MNSKIREIQLECLKILDITHRICVENAIQYSLCGGSVVGAHLYKGCPPWDDDIDIMMTRENYNKFLKVAPSLLPKGLSIYNYHVIENPSNGITKIINDNTTYVEANGHVFGLFLDITVYDKIPINRFSRWIDMFLFKRLLTVTKGKMEGNSLKNKLRSLMIDWILPCPKKYLKLFEQIVVLLGNHASSYTYSELFGAWAQTISYRPSVFENYTMIEFEGKEYMIVRDYVEYLTTRYNRTDFHEPKEKQVPPHIVYFDTSLPYRDYLKQHNE